MVKRFVLLLSAALVSTALVACAERGPEVSLADLPLCGEASPVSDLQAPGPAATSFVPPSGELDLDRVPFPEDYRETYKQFYVFDRFDAGAISYVCANEIAAGVRPGEAYPYGSVLLSEAWVPLRDGDGEFVLDDDGRLIRSELSGILLMKKEEGYGAAYGSDRSGEWEYVAYFPDGSYMGGFAPPEGPARCANCHAVAAGAERDWVFRTNLVDLPGRYARTDPVPEGELGISRMGYHPGDRSVSVGTTVTWRNSTIDATPHSVIAEDGSFASQALGPGETFSHTFTEPGSYEYACGLHPEWMRASIEVVE